MQALIDKARGLLESGAVKVVIGFATGSDDQRTRAHFARTPQQAAELIWNDRCRQNLATYLLKPEVKAMGKAAVVARPATLRAVLQLAVENQLIDESVVLLAVTDDGKVTELPNFAAIETHLASVARSLEAAEQAELKRFAEMPLDQRWAFWSMELARCVKCYACRAACPLCYCSRCITDVNQPQWVPVCSDALGNLEWNVVRAMHLAGRCVDCGSCSDACPEGIRLDLLNRTLGQEAMAHFGAAPGYSVRKDYALASFKPDDKEEFIR